MKLFRRLLLTGLALVMTLSLCACAGSGTPSDPAGSNPTSDSKPTYELIEDLGGYEFTWGTIWNWANYPEEGATAYGDRRLESYNRVMQQYNCDIQHTTINAVSFSSELGRSIASGDKYYDFFQVDFSRYQATWEDLMPLNTLDAINIEDDKWIDSVTKMYTGVDGNVYGLGYDYQRMPFGYMMVYNKTLLQAFNQPDPYELVKNNQWNFETFAQIARNLTKRSTDGKVSQWGLSGIDWNASGVELPFIFANGGRQIKKDAEGMWKFAMLDDDAQYALNYLHQLIAVDGVLHYTAPQQGAYENFADGKVGFFICGTDYLYGLDSGNNPLKEGIEWGIVPLPMGPDATEYQSFSTDGLGWAMMKVNPDADKAAKIFNAIADPVYETVEKDKEAFFRTFKATYLTGSDQKLEMLQKCIDSVIINEAWGVPGMPETIAAAITECVHGSEYTPKVAMETISGTCQWYIDAYFYGVEDEYPPEN